MNKICLKLSFTFKNKLKILVNQISCYQIIFPNKMNKLAARMKFNFYAYGQSIFLIAIINVFIIFKLP